MALRNRADVERENPNKEDIELEGGLCMPLRLDDEFIEECELVTVVNIVINKENSYD